MTTEGQPLVVDAFSRFASGVAFEDLPAEVMDEAKRVLLDSLGCALAGGGELKGRAGVDIARLSRAPDDYGATVIGHAEPSSMTGAAFANAELTSALDFDAVLAPGHVAPVVVPVALAQAEALSASGRDVLAAIAVGHELSCRISLGMDGLRDVADGAVVRRPVVGYSCIVFGAAAAAARLMRVSEPVLASALGIAGSTAPVHAHGAWAMHAPSTTLKYMVAGTFAQTALTAAHLAASGHQGDLRMLDDPEYGFAAIIGSSRWEREVMLDGLGTDWRFPQLQAYKHYPHCRVLHGVFDVLIGLVQDNDLKPDEIDQIRTWGEGWHRQPVWLNTTIDHVIHAQNSMSHGVALAAHGIPAGKVWQDPHVVFDQSVMDLMTRVITSTHPDYNGPLESYPASRPVRVEIDARGATYSRTGQFPRGGPSPDPSTRASTDELVEKFLTNAKDVMRQSEARMIASTVLALDEVGDIRTLGRLLRL